MLSETLLPSSHAGRSWPKTIIWRVPETMTRLILWPTERIGETNCLALPTIVTRYPIHGSMQSSLGSV